MEFPKIDYGEENLNSQKIAYDLALVYAKAKLDHALLGKDAFKSAYVERELNEVEYLRSNFLFALQHLSRMEPGEIEQDFKNFSDGEPPARV